MKKVIPILLVFTLFNCNDAKKGEMKSESMTPENTNSTNENVFPWEAANIYFLLTDRFNNSDTTNDLMYDRKGDAAKLRGYMGGDLKGVTQKIEEGYFTDLGINAIWMTPIVENIHGDTDEGTGKSYGFHGYWAKDWTAIDANLGTREDLKQLVDTAHSKGIRVDLDAVINHTGPVAE